MLYEFRQNNSGGAFVINSTLDTNLWIEADSPKEANKAAQSIGVYFDGCEIGVDCSCCGDRWHRVDDHFDAVKIEYVRYLLEAGHAKRIKIMDKNGKMYRIGQNLDEIPWRQSFHAQDRYILEQLMEKAID
jgi:hypothetical protein